TSTIAPFHSRRAFPIAAREGGSRLFVGSSSSNRLWRPATSIASASFVFSPPESVPASWHASSPRSPNMASRPRRDFSPSAAPGLERDVLEHGLGTEGLRGGDDLERDSARVRRFGQLHAQ